MKQDQRLRQSDKEALLALGVYALYFAWWYFFGYGVGGGAPEEYDYVFGFPAWFFYSCIVGYPIITILLWAVVRFLFKDIPLDSDDTDNSDDMENTMDAGKAASVSEPPSGPHSAPKSEDHAE